MTAGRQVRLLWSGVDLLTERQLVANLAESARTRRRITVGNHNMHSLYVGRRDERLHRFYEQADLVFVDGMPLIWALRAGGAPALREHRLTGLDWLHPLLERTAAGNMRVVHLGGHIDTSERAAGSLRRSHRGLDLHVLDGHFDARPNSQENRAVLADIERLAPDILLVGMGMPRQEMWIQANRDLLSAPVVVAIGGTFSYLGGEQRTPPRWLGRWGLEGAFRLATGPRRLHHRYTIEPIVLAPALLRDIVSRRLRHR